MLGQELDAEEILVDLLARREASANERGLGIFIARGFKDAISEEERIILAGEVVARRLVTKNYQTTMIIRQSEFVAHWLMKEVLVAAGFPVPTEDLEELFNHVSKAKPKGKNESQEAYDMREKERKANIEQVRKKLTASLEDGKVVAILLPFYHAYMKWAISGDDPDKVKNIRKAQENFLGMVGFAFIETSFIAIAKDPSEGAEVGASFRAMRDEVMENLIEKLDVANKTFMPKQQSLKRETIEQLGKIYHASENHPLIRNYNESLKKANKLNVLCREVGQCFDKESQARSRLLKIGEIIDHAHDKVKKAIARGDLISEDDMQNIDALLNEQLEQMSLNQKYAGMTPLQLAAQQGKDKLVKDLLQAGADPTLTSTEYERSRKQKLKDLSASTPPRNGAQIAEINGHAQIAALIQAEISRREKEKAAIPPKKERDEERSPATPSLVAAALHAESFAADRKYQVAELRAPSLEAENETRREWTYVIERETKKNQNDILAVKKAMAEWEKLGDDAAPSKQKMAFYLRIKFALTELSNFIPTAKSNQAISEKARVVLKQVEDRLGADHNVCQILSRIGKGERADEAPRAAPRKNS